MSDQNQQTNKPKTVIVTGASSGIGYGVAEAFLKRGDNVVLNSRNEAKLKAAAKRLGESGRTLLVPGDITLPVIGRRIVEVAIEEFGRVDVLFNNAGVFAAKPFADYSEDELDDYLSYLKGTYLISQAAAGQMKKQGAGSIINITTVLVERGVTAIPSSAPIAAKGGIQALTTNLAIELAADNIRVNAVAPGIIKTPIHGRTQEQFEELNGMQPLGRVGEVNDIVDAVLYLAEATFVTGVILPVDGGVSAGG